MNLENVFNYPYDLTENQLLYTGKTMAPIKLRLTYSKTGLIRFISHRDLLRLFFRAFTRAGLPVRYSEGYNPHPRVAFCPPLKVGMEGLNELLEINLARPVEEEPVTARLNEVMPRGIRVKDSVLLTPGTASLGRAIREAEYQVRLRGQIEVTAEGIRSFLANPEVWVEYEKEGKIKAVDARNGVQELELDRVLGEDSSLWMFLSVTENGRPYEVLSALSGAERALIPALRWQRLRFRGPGLG